MRFKDAIENCQIEKRGIIHIGAHEGEEASLYNEIGFSHVLWIEADPTIFEKLALNIKQYPKQKAINYLVSDSEKIIPFYIASNEGNSSSILPFSVAAKDVWPGIHAQKVINIESKRLDSILSEKDIKENYNCLNIDLQGAELIALKGIGNLLPLFEFCVLELNFKATYKNAAKFPELNKYFNENGFKLKYINLGKYQGEGVYIKSKRPYSKQSIAINLFIYRLINIIAISGIIDVLRRTMFGDFIRFIKNTNSR